MSTLSLRLPESLHRRLRDMAEREGVSINQFIATAVAEKAAALLTVDYLEERARRSSVQLFDRLLARVPDVPADPGDELPVEHERARKRAHPRKAAQRARKSCGS